jgi:protein SCO1/2
VAPGGGVALVLLAAAASLRLARGETSGLNDFGPSPAFALSDQLGRSVELEDYRGQVVVASFIYTSCRDICPALSLRMRALQERLRQERLQMLSFTVDPARDTPAVLRAYAERHQADPEAWRFLSGPVETLVPLTVEGFRLGVQALPPTGDDHGDVSGHSYDVTHSGRFVLIDREGRIRAYYDGTDVELDRIIRDIRSLLD